MLTFLINFLVYLIAFAIGAAIMWFILKAVWPAGSADEAFEDIDASATRSAK